MSRPASAVAGPPVDTGVPPPGDPDTARRALRRLTSAVTVLTVHSDGRHHGTTVSAVVAVSRDPLILGACLRPASTFTTLVRRAARFSVNVLSADQEPVARWFADPDRPDDLAQFAKVDWAPDLLTGAPLIDGCLAHLACSVIDRQRIGDHDLLVAEVIGGTPISGEPLISFAARLHHGLPEPHEY